MSGSGRNDQGELAELDCRYAAERTKSNVIPQTALSGPYQEGNLEDGDEG